MAPKASSGENISARRAPHAFNSYQYTISQYALKKHIDIFVTYDADAEGVICHLE